MRRLIKRCMHWIILILFTDIVYIFIAWLIRREALKYMSLFLFLYTAFAFLAGLLAEFYRNRRDNAMLQAFLQATDGREKEDFLLSLESDSAARALCMELLKTQSLLNERTVERNEYREYIESWVHEAKTPLSLFPLVLNNHREEMSPYVYGRFHYIQRQLNENLERILYYARLSAEHTDIKFTRFFLDACVEEAAFEYEAFMEERGISFSFQGKHIAVLSDKKVVLFLISQLMSNAVKYADAKEGRVWILMNEDDQKIRLGIYNNGEGVPPEDAPFIFDKGFTGSYPNRQKATGMGLYLVRKYAEKLCVSVSLDSRIPYREGFGIELEFPI